MIAIGSIGAGTQSYCMRFNHSYIQKTLVPTISSSWHWAGATLCYWSRMQLSGQKRKFVCCMETCISTHWAAECCILTCIMFAYSYVYVYCIRIFMRELGWHTYRHMPVFRPKQPLDIHRARSWRVCSWNSWKCLRIDIPNKSSNQAASNGVPVNSPSSPQLFGQDWKHWVAHDQCFGLGNF